jgi:hypothetical protein
MNHAGEEEAWPDPTTVCLLHAFNQQKKGYGVTVTPLNCHRIHVQLSTYGAGDQDEMMNTVSLSWKKVRPGPNVDPMIATSNTPPPFS